VPAVADPAVAALADDYWAFHRDTSHFWHIDRGDVDHVERWEDLSSDGVAARIDRLDEFARRAHVVEPLAVTARDQSVVAAVAFSARSTGVTLSSMRDLGLVAGPASFAMFLAELVPATPLTTAAHGAGYAAKLRALPDFVDGWIDGLRTSTAVGRRATARGVAAAIAELDELLAVDVGSDPLARHAGPSELAVDATGRWRDAVVDEVRASVRPAIERFRTFLRDELLPGAPGDDRPGICHWPGGSGEYDELLVAATSTEMSAHDVHSLGLERLALLDDEYRVLGDEALGIDDPALIRARLRDDVGLRYGDVDELIADANAVLQRAGAAAPAWFARLPRAPCRIVPVRGGGFAYYTGPSPDGARGGTCHLAVGEGSAWTRCNLEATIFHESVPGHHLQIALALEADLHPVLGELEVTSYGEGWGLYAERLADEMSLYGTPLARLGMLTLDSLRAVRLVVDTGLHAMGWTRDRAIDAVVDATPLPQRVAEAEVDRYIANPGQATSYMVGRLHIERIRRDAEAVLGPRFRRADFHDALLGNGMVPLPALARTMADWARTAA
jgi:uncharacterized protein (DUF885 family)